MGGYVKGPGICYHIILYRVLIYKIKVCTFFARSIIILIISCYRKLLAVHRCIYLAPYGCPFGHGYRHKHFVVVFWQMSRCDSYVPAVCGIVPHDRLGCFCLGYFCLICIHRSCNVSAVEYICEQRRICIYDRLGRICYPYDLEIIHGICFDFLPYHLLRLGYANLLGNIRLEHPVYDQLIYHYLVAVVRKTPADQILSGYLSHVCQ